LIHLLDSPHLVLRQAAKQAMPEFSFNRFAAAFDMLDDEVRETTGALVKKMDSQVLPLLREELQSLFRSRRLRALQMIPFLNMAESVENIVIDLLRDEDHFVRAEAAAVLGSCRSPESRCALEEALHDTSIVVQEAVQKSIEEQK
jgi:HEAT repeat protein